LKADQVCMAIPKQVRASLRVTMSTLESWTKRATNGMGIAGEEESRIGGLSDWAEKQPYLA